MNPWIIQLLFLWAFVSYGCWWLVVHGEDPTEEDEPADPIEPPYDCKFCGAPSWVHPSDQEWPVDYCHDADHGTAEDYRG